MIKPGNIYRHYKGDEYKVLAIGKHTETEEDMVIYHLANNSPLDTQIWIRPLEMFVEKTEYEGRVVKRFTLLEEVLA